MFAYIFRDDGSLAIRETCDSESAAEQLAVANGHRSFVVSKEEFGDDDVYFSGGLVAKPTRPSMHHAFDYTTKQWIDPRTPATEWPIVRAKRNQLLQQSDWTQLPDVPLATKEAWAAYRQALRDVTLQPDPFNIVWPTPPA